MNFVGVFNNRELHIVEGDNGFIGVSKVSKFDSWIRMSGYDKTVIEIVNRGNIFRGRCHNGRRNRFFDGINRFSGSNRCSGFNRCSFVRVAGFFIVPGVRFFGVNRYSASNRCSGFNWFSFVRDIGFFFEVNRFRLTDVVVRFVHFAVGFRSCHYNRCLNWDRGGITR